MAMSTDKSFLDRAIDIITVATSLDKEGNFDAAFPKYREAVEMFLLALKYEKNPKTKEMLHAKVAEYLRRTEELAAFKKSQDSGPHKSQKSDKPTSSGGDDKYTDEELVEFQQQLEGTIMTEKPNIRWSDVAGLDAAKEALKEACILPLKFPHLFSGKRRPWKGILLYGPPGTGKTYLARAVASEADVTFINVSASDLMSKWLGESEKLVKSLFRLARVKAPCIIFIDEIDSLVSTRGGGESEAGRRVKTEFLVQMGGVGSGDTSDQVLVLAATNIPWALDTAIRRRLERRIYLPLPDLDTRIKLLQIQMKGIKCVLTDADYQEFGEMTEGFSGSDITIAVQDALFVPVRKIQSATHFRYVPSQDPNDTRLFLTPCSPGDPRAMEMNYMQVEPWQLIEPAVEKRDLLMALSNAKPSVSEDDLKKHMAFQAEFGAEQV